MNLIMNIKNDKHKNLVNQIKTIVKSKGIKSPISFSLRDKLFIETPTVNFNPRSLAFLIISNDFFEKDGYSI